MAATMQPARMMTTVALCDSTTLASGTTTNSGHRRRSCWDMARATAMMSAMTPSMPVRFALPVSPEMRPPVKISAGVHQ